MAFATLDAAITAIQTAVGAVTGIAYAPANPPDQASAYPFITTFPATFTSRANTPEDFRTLYDIVIELHVSRRDSTQGIDATLPFSELVLKAIWTVLNNNETASGDISGQFGESSWGGIPTLAFAWTIREVKIITTL